MSLTLICPPPDCPGSDGRLEEVLSHALAGREVTVLRRAEELSGLAGRRLLFALPLGEWGSNLEQVRILTRLRREPPYPFCLAALDSSLSPLSLRDISP